MVLPELEEQQIQTLNVVKEIQIAAPPEIVFESLLHPVGKFGEMKLRFEAWPGGRWFRDLGNNTGHLWGHVQVIKPPELLELTGPMFMSYPVASHVQYRVTPQGGGSLLRMTHKAIGLIPDEHLSGVQNGWQMLLDETKLDAEARAMRK
jgi:uncharacterized protein YndB with AHSA1/START domain